MKIQDSEILRRSSVFRFLSDEHFGAIEPLFQEEHYDFILPRARAERPPVRRFIDLLEDEGVRRALTELGFAP